MPLVRGEAGAFPAQKAWRPFIWGRRPSRAAVSRDAAADGSTAATTRALCSWGAGSERRAAAGAGFAGPHKQPCNSGRGPRPGPRVESRSVNGQKTIGARKWAHPNRASGAQAKPIASVERGAGLRQQQHRLHRLRLVRAELARAAAQHARRLLHACMRVPARSYSQRSTIVVTGPALQIGRGSRAERWAPSQGARPACTCSRLISHMSHICAPQTDTHTVYSQHPLWSKGRRPPR